MKVRLNLLTILFVLSLAAYAFSAEENHQQGSDETMMEDMESAGNMAAEGIMNMEAAENMNMEEEGNMEAETPSAVEVGNKVCPVSGEKIGGMGPAVQYEYKGKIYNFCCSGCVEEFKKDPEKYVKIVEQQMAEDKDMEKNMEMGEEAGNEGPSDMMGETGGHMDMGKEQNMPMMKPHEK